MRRRRLLGVPATAAVGTAVVASLLPTAPAPVAAANPLTIPSATLDFGERLEPGDFSWAVPVSNAGRTTLRVTPAVSGCSCRLANVAPFDLAAGETRTLELTVDAAQRCVAHADKFRVPFAVELRLKADGLPDGKYSLRGVARRGVLLPQPAAEFGRRPRHEAFAEKTLSVAVTPDVSALNVTATDGIDATATRDGDRFTLRTRPRNDGTPGRHLGKVTLTPRTAAGTPYAAAAVELRWEILGDVRATPAELLLGDAPVGTQLAGRVTLFTPGGGAFRVREAVVETGDGTTGIEPVSGFEYEVKMTLRENQTLQRAVLFRVVLADGREETVRVPVIGTGTNFTGKGTK